MSIEVFYSSNYKELRNQFIKISDQEKGSIFQFKNIFYQAKGIIDRLPMDLAAVKGFFGGFNFYPVFNMEHILLKILGNNIEEEVSATELIWVIFSALGEEDYINHAPEVKAYIDNDELRRMLFAIKMQETFSGYIEYRSDILAKWENYEICTHNRHEKWQAALWRAVLNRSEQLKKTVHQNVLLLEELNSGVHKEKLNARLSTIYFFGISTLSPKISKLLKTLSELTEIKLFLFSPISDSPVNNSIYKYLSKLAHESFETLSQYFSKEKFNYLKTELKQQNNLQNLQHYILNSTSNYKLKLLEDDHLIVNSCYTAVRELESLYQHLLYLISKEKNLFPKDILVLIPDLEEYTPFISSVFEQAPKQFLFPYSIEKQSFSDKSTEIALFEALINFNPENFSAEQVMQLLENEKLSYVFGIFDLQKIREFLSEANIRYSFKGEGSNENENYIVSFLYGLKRLMYGFALGEQIDYQSDGINFEAKLGDEIYPVCSFNGISDLKLLSGFYGLITTLNHMLEKRKEPRSFTDWITYLQKTIIDPIFSENQINDDEELGFDTEEDSNDKYEKNDLRRLIAEFSEIERSSTTLISFDSFRILLNSFINTDVTQRGKLKGGINFAQYQSVQGLDYKFIAILGLNYDALPRKKQLAAFNIMNETRKGDISLKDTDKYTFLQTLLAAQDYLYLSYIGRSPKDNSKRPPSVLVELVLDAFDHGQETATAESKFWIQHPLHAFSDKYNDLRYPMLRSYHFEKGAQQRLTIKETEESKTEISTITLDKIISFFKNPFKHYLNKVLHIFLDEKTATLPEIEVFNVTEHLIEYNLKKDLTEMNTREQYGEKLQNYIRKMKHSGKLPLGKIAEKHVKKYEDIIQPLRDRYESEQGENMPENVSISLHLDSGIKLHHNLKHFGAKQIIFSVSKKTSVHKYKLEAWIRHVFAIAAGLEIDTVLILLEDGTKFLPKNCLQKKEALTILDGLCRLYKSSQNELLAYDAYFKDGMTYKNYIEYKYLDEHVKFALSFDLFNEKKLFADHNKLKKFLSEQIERFLN